MFFNSYKSLRWSLTTGGITGLAIFIPLEPNFYSYIQPEVIGPQQLSSF